MGRQLRLYLVDGAPTGLLTAEIVNWTGHLLIGPRSRIGEVLRRDEANRTGVYFLSGDDPDQPSKPKVYIGEGDSLSDRIKNHARDESKEFWTKACLVTSKDPNLTKAHARYLESRLIELARRADRANLANGTEPVGGRLPEADISDMEFFLEQLQVILPVIGLDFLRPRPTSKPDPNPAAIPVYTSPTLELVLESKKHGIDATAVEVDGEVTVLAGSKAYARDDFVTNSYGHLRKQLIEDGRLKPAPGGAFLEFAEDVTFNSPSAASSVIFNRNSNGRSRWRVRGTEQSLKDWQDAQIT